MKQDAILFNDFKGKELFDFYTGRGRDGAGRTFEDVMAFTNDEMEEVHDYIQWLFPASTPSMFNADAPVLDLNTCNALQQEDMFHERFQRALKKVLDFWGFGYLSHNRNIKVLPLNLSHLWMTPNNHNLLRMSRVMECCYHFKYQTTGLTLFEALLKCSTQTQFISPTNIYYWYKSAFGRPI